MGNFWIAHFDSSSSSPCSTRPSSPAISKNNSNEGTHSGSRSEFYSSMNEVSPYGQILPITPTLRIFSFAELKKATRNFSFDALVQVGGFGQVFEGSIDEKIFAPTKAGSEMAIAVKKLSPEALQRREEWQSEVTILGSLSHPNIVRLLGHCEEDKELLLVYEFMPRGSLAKNLFRRGSAFQSFSWSIWLKIAIGAARGLAFLHCSERKIIHCNLKSSNILLDWNYNARISYFGLARNGLQGEDSHVSTRVVGTDVYTAPEYLTTGHLYVKSDVYSFGVVLLEMLSGMRALDDYRPYEQQNLVKWAEPYLSDWSEVLSRVMDRRLEGHYPSEGAVQAARLILQCLSPDPRNRPSMTQVVEALEQIQAIKHMPLEPKNETLRPADHNHSDHHARICSPLHPKAGFTKSTSNEGMHSGTGSAFSSSLNEVSPNGQILPITPTLKIFSFAELKKATRNIRPDKVLGEGGFGQVFKNWIDGKTFAPTTLKIFSFAELKKATRNFRPDKVLGDGSSGTVSKGWIDEMTFAPTKAGSGMAIAVKKLKPDDFQGHEEWQSEVNILGSLSHPNIVRLLGYCEEEKELLLVYEFMPGGSLESLLFRRRSFFPSLSWSKRLKIAIGAARGVAFLHCSERKIIYRSVKPSDILLDLNYNAKISDFGLARNDPQAEDSHVSTCVMGTYGYAAPEYVATGRLHVNSDVYGFGVLLLEMLSGLRAIDRNRPRVQQNLVHWAKPYLSDELKVYRLMDRRLEGRYSSEGAVLAARLILACLNSDRRERPSMMEVVEALEQIQAIKYDL
ncbi:Protein kinase domain-containing protein [Cinnamomum micranthum f. kanehirae]|uniref:non-specific serine/threonine protein kinase n=1 Tax=Cinnamomum micranthum f. kanehirae TaxID=337451 RepID=A0A3S3M7H7_9MAGN|nr:Protein kinase domain-containing protein [Cinnamomum micranthum f. kanehirae]